MREVTLAILAGGAGSRMGGPKGSLTVRGEPILQFLMKRMKWRGPTLLVTGPGMEHPPGATLFDREVCDVVPGLGPLGGVRTALEQSATEITLISTVDMPLIADAQLEWLAQRLCESPALWALMLMRDGQIEPFPSAWRRDATPVVAEQLARQALSVRGLLKFGHFRSVPAPLNWPPATWTNLNVPQDLAALSKFLAAHDRRDRTYLD